MAADNTIGRLATIVTLACVAVVALTIAAVASPNLRSRFGFGRAPSYPAGSQIDVPRELFDKEPLTLLLFVRANCSACQNAKPAFNAIRQEMERASIRTKLITNGLHGDDEVLYSKELGVEPANMTSTDMSAIRLQVVPTLVLVNQRGNVIYSAEGIPTDSQREDLLEAVAAQTSAR